MRRGGLLVLILCLMASACARGQTTAGPQPETQASTAPAGTVPPSSEVAAPSDAPSADVVENLAFTADLVGGGQLEGGDLAGRDVVLWFWAPW